MISFAQKMSMLILMSQVLTILDVFARDYYGFASTWEFKGIWDQV